MAKMENRIEAGLAKLKIDLTGVDFTKARSKANGVRFLSTAVREALANAPKVAAPLNDLERATIAAWIERAVMGKAVNPAALTSACSAAVTALELSTRATVAPPVQVVAGSGAEAMKRAMAIRKKRGAARTKSATKSA